MLANSGVKYDFRNQSKLVRGLLPSQLLGDASKFLARGRGEGPLGFLNPFPWAPSSLLRWLNCSILKIKQSVRSSRFILSSKLEVTGGHRATVTGNMASAMLRVVLCLALAAAVSCQTAPPLSECPCHQVVRECHYWHTQGVAQVPCIAF